LIFVEMIKGSLLVNSKLLSLSSCGEGLGNFVI
jgi:hypothetical protein